MHRKRGQTSTNSTILGLSDISAGVWVWEDVDCLLSCFQSVGVWVRGDNISNNNFNNTFQ